MALVVMRASKISIAAAAFVLVSGATDVPVSIDEIDAFCKSETMDIATAKAEALKWYRRPDEDLESWRSGFVAANRREVIVRAWRQFVNDGADTLSFWIAAGPDGHKGCAYTTARAADLFDWLSAHFGPPVSLDNSGIATTATWKSAGADISFSQVGTHAVLYVKRLIQ